MPKRNQEKKDKRNPHSGRAKRAKRRKTTAKGPTSTRTARPSRAFSPTLSETERRARQAIVLMDLDVIQNYFEDNELSPPNTTFKSDWADVYASACAVRRLSGLDPLPSLPQAKAFKAPGPKKKKGVKRKTPPRPKKGDKKDAKATPPHPGLPPQEPGSESTDVTLQRLSKLSPAHREKFIEALLQLRGNEQQDDSVDKGLGLGSNPALKKKKSLFLDANTPLASDASGTDEGEDDDEDTGEDDDTEARDDHRDENKEKKTTKDQLLATQVKNFFSEMTEVMTTLKESAKATQPAPQGENRNPPVNHAFGGSKNDLPSSPKGTLLPHTPFQFTPSSPFMSTPGGKELKAAWRTVPGLRTDDAATRQWSRIYDAAKKAVALSAPAPLIAWRKVTHDLEMWNRLSDLDRQSGDAFLLNLDPFGTDPFKVSRRSRPPPKITNWTSLWEAFDNRAATVCIFFPADAAGTIVDRATLKSLQDGGMSYSAAEEWANTAMYKANAPCKPFGPPDNETMMKLWASKTTSPSPGPKPQGQGTRQLGKKLTPQPLRQTQGTPTAPSKRAVQDALRILVNKTCRDNIKTHSICRKYNMGFCSLGDKHPTSTNPDALLAHKCCVCLKDHPASVCPDAGLPTP